MSAVPVERATCRPVVIPYYAEKHNFTADLLPGIYGKLRADNILPDLIPEGDISEQEFIEFVNGPALLSLFLDLESQRFAGLAWITQIEEGPIVKKGCASVAFFREWWKPNVTNVFGRLCLDQWFSVQEFNLVYAMTPAANVKAVRYTERLGFTYRANLPGFTSYRGELCDGRIAMITKDEFHAKENQNRQERS